MRVKLTSLICLMLVCFCAISYNNTMAEEINKSVLCAKDMVGILTNTPKLKSMNKNPKQSIVDVAFPYFDLEWTAKMSIGINYKKMTEAEQRQYLKEFAKFFSYIWLPYLYIDNTLGARMVVNDKTTKINNDEYVDVVIYSPDGKTFNLKLRIRNKPEWEHCKILDVIVDGVDLAMSYRSQFDAYIEKNNGKSSSVIDYLKEKNLQYKKTSGIVLPIE